MTKDSKRNKYIVIEQGVDFRTVANLMTGLGFEMNHATARNNFSNAMESLVKNIITEIKSEDESASTDDIEKILKNQQIYNAFPEILYKANKLLIKESGKKTEQVSAAKNNFIRFNKGNK